MNTETEVLVRAVTEQVLAALKKENKLPDVQNEGKPKCLVLGELNKVPETLQRDVVLLDVKDYEKHQNILRYNRVLITQIGLVDLADIAVGRPGSPLTCAISRALLQGVEVMMLENAPQHRAYAGQGSTMFYRVLEGHVNTLQTFGVKLIQSSSAILVSPADPNETKAVRRELEGVRLITEELALSLAREVQELVLPAGTILTPAAADVLKAAKVKLIRR